MNRENMAKVADAIEQENVQFDMATWNHNSLYTAATFGDAASKGDFCGTSACIGGTATLLQAMDKVKESKNYSIQIVHAHVAIDSNELVDTSASWLGLDEEEAHDLFFCHKLARELYGNDNSDNLRKSYAYINRLRKYVPDALRWMIHTGTVDWKQALKAAKKAAKCRAGKTDPVQEPA